jgi:acyl-CoA hydrolase
LQVDFLGQCCSESIGSIPYSGSGGQLDFVRAANISRGGKSFLMLRSTAKNGTISRIVPMLTQGAHVTVGKNDVDYIVSEFGVAHLRGKTAAERTREMIAIAHPDYRAELKAAAKKMNYM